MYNVFSIMKAKIKSALKNIFKLAFSVLLIVWLVSSEKFDLSQLRLLLSTQIVFFVLLLMAISNFFASERWRSILISQGFSLTFWETLKLTYIGLFFNFAMPGGVGGDVVKGFYIAKNNSHRKFISVFTIFLDRIIGLFAMSIMAFLAVLSDFKFIWHNENLKIISIILGFLVFIFILFWGVAFSTGLRSSHLLQSLLNKLPHHHRVYQLWDSLLQIKEDKSAFLKALFFSFGAQICAILVFILCGKVLGLQLPIFTYFVAVPIGFMITAIPISPAGIGVGQAAFLYLFNVFSGDENNLGAIFITAFQAASLFWSLLGAYFYLTMKGVRLTSTQSPLP